MSAPVTHRRAGRRPQPVTVLGVAGLVVLLVIAYVAFTANDGVPLLPTSEVTVEVPNADRLIRHDKVSIAGVRAGQVAAVEAVPARGGRRPYARLRLTLDGGAVRLPVDTAVKVRPGAVLGSSYVDLVPGRSTRMVGNGGVLPLERASRAVQLTDLLDAFRGATRRDVQRTLHGLGDGLAGRGPDMNTTLLAINQLLDPLRRVSAAMAAPGARLPDFLRGWAAASRTFASASADLQGVVTGGAGTFSAFARERAALRAAIAEAPSTETAVTIGMRAIRPGLRNLARLSRELRPAGRELRPALGDGSRTLRAGTTALASLAPLARRLDGTVAATRAVARQTATVGTLQRLRDVFRESTTFLDAFTPAQVTCNIMPLWARIGPVFGAFGTGNGPALTQIWLTGPGATGESLQNKEPSPDSAINFSPRTNAEECEAGNEPYTGLQVLDNPPSKEPNSTLGTSAPADSLRRARDAGLMTRLEDER